MEAERALALNPPLFTSRLALEPLEEAHADLLFEPMQAEAIYTWISGGPPETLTLLREAWLRLSLCRLSPDGKEAWLGWAVRRLDDGHYIGKLDVSIDERMVGYNVGYLFFPPYWGQGYAAEAVTALSQAMLQLGVSPLYGYVTRGNLASCRVLEKSGYRFTRILPDNDTIRGVPYDDLEYVLP